MTTENEQIVLDAFERGKAFGFAEGLRQQAEEIAELRNFISLDEYRKTEWYAYELDNEMKRYKKASEK